MSLYTIGSMTHVYRTLKSGFILLDTHLCRNRSATKSLPFPFYLLSFPLVRLDRQCEQCENHGPMIKIISQNLN